eukprot:3066123-Rhodomonas_salina.1
MFQGGQPLVDIATGPLSSNPLQPLSRSRSLLSISQRPPLPSFRLSSSLSLSPSHLFLALFLQSPSLPLSLFRSRFLPLHRSVVTRESGSRVEAGKCGGGATEASRR